MRFFIFFYPILAVKFKFYIKDSSRFKLATMKMLRATIGQQFPQWTKGLEGRDQGCPLWTESSKG